MGMFDDLMEDDAPKKGAGMFDDLLKPPRNKNALQDAGVALASGILKVPSALTGAADTVLGLFGADRPVSRAADAIGDFTGLDMDGDAKKLEQRYSEQHEQTGKEADKVWDDDSKTWVDVAKFYAMHPEYTANQVLGSLGSIAAGGAVSKGLKGATALGAATRAGIGEGTISAGQTMSEIDPSVDPQKAAAAALTSGAAVAGLGVAGGKLAGKLGVNDLDTLLAGGARAKGGLMEGAGKLARTGAGVVQEGLEEAPQSAVEQMAGNFAEDKPLMEGVKRASTEGAIAGGIMGGGTSMLSSTDKPPAPQPETRHVPPAGDPTFDFDKALNTVAPDAAPDLTTRDFYTGMVGKNSALLKPGRGLIGRDLSNADQVTDVINILQAYGDKYANADQRPLLEQKIAELETARQNLTTNNETTKDESAPPLASTSASPDGSVPRVQGVQNDHVQENGSSNPPVAGADIAAMGGADPRTAVSGGSAGVGRVATQTANGTAGTNNAGKAAHVAALNPAAPQPPGTQTPISAIIGNYSQATASQPKPGGLGTAVNAAGTALSNAKAKGAKRAATDFEDRVVQETANYLHGYNRLMPDEGWTAVDKAGNRTETARAKLQWMAYWPQATKVAQMRGYIAKGKEDNFVVVDDPTIASANIFKDVLNTAVPGGQDASQVFNGIMNNLTVAEREARMGRTKRPPGVTDASIRQAKKDAALFKPQIMALKQNKDHQMDMLEQGGLISPQLAATLKQDNFYMPMYRLMNTDEDFKQLIGSTVNGANGKNVFKGYKGSELQVGDIIENWGKLEMHLAQAAIVNDATRKAIFTINKDHPGLVRVTATPTTGKNVVSFRHGGKKLFAVVHDKMLYESLSGLQLQEPTILERVAEPFTHFFREMIMLSPDAIFRNMTRDIPEAWIYGMANKNFVKAAGSIVGNFGKGVARLANDTVHGHMQIPTAEVSLHGLTGELEHVSQQREINRILKQTRRARGGFVNQLDAVISGVSNVAQGVAMQAELATRNHIYKEVLARTGSEVEARMAAINHIDFRRRGRSRAITFLKRTVPFANSLIQGAFKAYDALRNNRQYGLSPASMRKILLGNMFKLASLAAMYSLLMADDDEYKEVPQELRDNSIMVPVSEDSEGRTIFMRLALPFDLGGGAWLLGQQIGNAFTGNFEADEAKDTAVHYGKQYMINITPALLKPFIEYMTNYDTFTKDPIVPYAQKDVAPKFQERPGTTGLAKGLGAATDSSPILIDHLIRGYTGSIGASVVALVDKALAGDDKPATEWHRQPVLKSVFTDPSKSEYVNDFYRLKEDSDEVKKTVDKLRHDRRADALRSYLQEDTNGVPNIRLHAMNKLFTKYAGMMADIRTAETAIGEDKETSPEQRRAKMNALRARANAWMQQVQPLIKQLSRTTGNLPEDEAEEEDTADAEE